MLEKTEHLPLPPIQSLPLRKRLANVTIDLKKKPLKKEYTQNRKLSQGNPLLWDGKPASSTEDTIDLFKSTWLSEQEKSCVVKKPTKKKRPSVSKSTEKTRKRSTDGKLYCICRQSYDATRFMIACDRCDDWFHGECIGINEKESEFIDLYFCIKCSKVTKKSTSWKPKCANPACHKAARIGSNQGHVSKYCSDSCGLQVARARLELVEMKRRQTCFESTSIAHLSLLKQRQLRINSMADKQDRDRLIEISKEKIGIRDKVKEIDKKLGLLHHISPGEDHCGFDARLISAQVPFICLEKNCLKHKDWKTLLHQEYQQEKAEQFLILTHIEKDRNQVKSRMRKRRNEKQVIQDLVNRTICV